jgi:hypothetical protein
MRRELKFSLLDDEAFERLKGTKVSSTNLSIDPPNYNILSNESYQKKLGYTPTHLQDTFEKKMKSDYVCKLLFC